MKKEISRLLTAACASMAIAAPVYAADNLLLNPSFENPNEFFDFGFGRGYEGWLVVGGFSSIEMPPVAAVDGSQALRLSNFTPGDGTVLALSVKGDFSANFPVQTGQEVYASASLVSDVPLAPGQANRMIKVVFYDANGVDISPASVSKGTPDLGDGDCFEFPGALSAPKLDETSVPGEWQKSQVQAIAPTDQNVLVQTCKDLTPDDGVNNPVNQVVLAPPGAVAVNLFLFNINQTGQGADVYFDNAFLGILEPDDDQDGIQNSVDVDPINASPRFSDGTTSGEILDFPNLNLNVDDSPDPASGVRLETIGGPARYSACNSLASVRMRANSQVDVTCGSISVDVLPGSEPVEVELTVEGQISIVTLPAENDFFFDDEDNTLIVAPTSETAEPATVSVDGGEPLTIVPGVELDFNYGLDIKPGSEDNCFNIDGNGVIPVAVLGGAQNNVADIDITTLDFNGLATRIRGNSQQQCGTEDVNGDGVSDLVCQFEDDTSTWMPGDSFASLTATLVDGSELVLSDTICVKP